MRAVGTPNETGRGGLEEEGMVWELRHQQHEAGPAQGESPSAQERGLVKSGTLGKKAMITLRGS